MVRFRPFEHLAFHVVMCHQSDTFFRGALDVDEILFVHEIKGSCTTLMYFVIKVRQPIAQVRDKRPRDNRNNAVILVLVA